MTALNDLFESVVKVEIVRPLPWVDIAPDAAKTFGAPDPDVLLHLSTRDGHTFHLRCDEPLLMRSPTERDRLMAEVWSLGEERLRELLALDDANSALEDT